MSSQGVAEQLYLMDEAFQGADWHSLLSNLRTVDPEDWLWVPPGGHRSIREIVGHVGECKIMYNNHAFGDATFTWDEPHVDAENALATVDSAIAWLKTTYEPLRANVEALDDSELNQPRKTNWGELKETRWIIGIMIQHDLYHAGEINHLRSLRGDRDRWEFEKE
jgi:hypothetical protein